LPFCSYHDIIKKIIEEPTEREQTMVSKDFSEYVQDKTFDEILHEGRRESADRILSEALTPLALLLSRELLKVLLLSPQALGGLDLSAGFQPSITSTAEKA
jgi:hypothetical protein